MVNCMIDSTDEAPRASLLQSNNPTRLSIAW